jgi:pimeloyl-ACP methyl ester carboxylesterase
MRLELISIPTDTYPLDGLYYQPDEGPSAGAALLMHGNCYNFYTGPMRFLPPMLVRLGYACLAYNRRGHDVVVTLNSREPGGGAFQIVDEAIADNRYAAQWLAARGFPSPVIIGHSNGGMLAVRHCADHPDTRALVLLSAHGGGRNLVPNGSKAGLFAGDRLEEFIAEAKANIAQGQGRKLMLMSGWWYVVTGQTFIDFSTNVPDLLAWAPKVKCPALFLRGDQEPASVYPAEAFRDRSGGPCEVKIVPQCDHFYAGCEEVTGDLIAGWLRDALPAKGGRAP